jgi:hypothetical protein
MAVVDVQVFHEGRQLDKTVERFRRTYKQSWIVQISDPTDDPNVILTDSRLPTLNVTTYPTDSGALCVAVNGRQTQTTWLFEYSFDSNPPVPGQQDLDPLARSVVWKTTAQKYTTAVDTDLTGTPYLNSAKQSFENPHERDNPRLVLTATKNYATYSDADIITYFGTINNAVWRGYPKWSVKIDGIDKVTMYENGTQYDQVVWTFLYEPNKWHPYKALDAGYYSLSAGVLTPLTDNRGQPLTKPKLLNGSGAVTTTPTYLSFTDYFEANWSSIP